MPPPVDWASTNQQVRLAAMSNLGFTFPTLAPPPAPRRGGRWAALCTAAALVGATIGAVYLACAVDAEAETYAWEPGVERRAADPGSSAVSTWPLRWLSRTHAAVALPARVDGRDQPATMASVVLDTGSSQPVATARPTKLVAGQGRTFRRRGTNMDLTGGNRVNREIFNSSLFPPLPSVQSNDDK